MSDTTHKCSQRVYDTRHFRGHQCIIAAKVERDGKWYCKRHDPEAVAKKRQEQETKWREKWAREDEELKRKQDAAAEQKRRADAFPDLLRELEHLVRLFAPLEAAGNLNVPGLATLNGARAAIAKARG